TEGDVARAEELLVLDHVAGQLRLLVCADAELGDVRAALATRMHQPQQANAVVAGGLDEVTCLHGELDGRRDHAEGRDRPVDDELALTRALERGDESLAARQVAER